MYFFTFGHIEHSLLPQREIRAYLEQKGLRLKAGKEAEPNFRALLPRSPPKSVVEKFVTEETGGPDLNHILLNWSEPLSSSSPWNKVALMLLATDFIATHQGHPPHLMKVEKIFKDLAAPLRVTKRKVEAFTEVPEDDDATSSEVIKNLRAAAEANDRRARRLARRTAVSRISISRPST